MNYQFLTDFWFVSFGLLILSTATLLVYYLAVFSHLAFKGKSMKLADEFEPVSVVICARNELSNLQANLESILTQDYPNFEVVVVNDGSDDDSNDYLRGLQLEHVNLKVIDLPTTPNFFKGKKFPLSVGIKSAAYDLLLLTDADCRPKSSQWIRLMQMQALGEIQVVLGYGGYEYSPGLLNALIRFDTQHIAIQYLSYARFGRPYMGVGRNLMYRKSLFVKHKGFSEHYTLASGDDDLFVNKVAGHTNTAVALGSEAMTLSSPKSTLRKWYDQKRRHLSTAGFYSGGDKIALGLYSLSQCIFYLSLIVSLATSSWWMLILALFGVKTVVQTTIYGLSMRKLDKSKLFIYSLFLEPLMLLLNSLFFISNRMSPRSKWK